MSTTKVDEASLRALLRVAFPATALSAVALVAHRQDADRARLATVLAGRAWTTLTTGEVSDLRDGLPFLTPAGFAAHLAAFLTSALDDDDVRESLVFALERPSEPSADGLDARQRAAVAAVLRWIDAAHGEDFADGEAGRAARRWEPART